MCPSSISSSERSAPFRFARRALLWLLPVWLPVVAIEAALWITGETRPIAAVAAAMQAKPDALFMRRYFDQGLYRFKDRLIQEREPTVLAVGTSRIMQFREPMFGDAGARFVNAGGMTQHLRDLEALAERLPDLRTVRAILLAVEPWWFNAEWAAIEERGPKSYATSRVRDDAASGFAHAAVWQRILWGTLRPAARGGGVGSLALLARRPGAASGARVGLLAVERDMGFRRDGSMRYPGDIPDPSGAWAFVDREEPPVVERIRGRRHGFEAAASMDDALVSRFLACVDRIREGGVGLVVFLPPFASDAAAELAASGAHRGAWTDYRERLPALLASRGVPCFVVTSPDALGLDDRCMYDGLHAMETFHVALLRRMADDRVAGPLLQLDASRLDRLLANPGTNPWFVSHD